MMTRRLLYIVFILLTFSCEEIINEVNISKETVILLAPANNVKVSTETTLNYTWQKIDNATKYRLQLATPNFENAIAIKLDTLIANTSFTHEKLTSGDYEWRVKATNNSYETAYSKNTFSVEAPK